MVEYTGVVITVTSALRKNKANVMVLLNKKAKDTKPALSDGNNNNNAFRRNPSYIRMVPRLTSSDRTKPKSRPRDVET